MSDSAEVWRLRRFALATALLLFAWSVAGITISEDTTFSPLRLPLHISRPDLLPLGLALAAVYGAARYFYYAFSLGTSPYRNRRDLLDALVAVNQRRGTPVHMYRGPVQFSVTPWHTDRERQLGLGEQLKQAFPKVGKSRVITKLEYDHNIDDEGNEYTSYGLSLTIPVPCRRAALFEDIDYASPVWFPMIAVAFWMFRVL